MKFLCLHGMGTSANILKAQLAPIITHFEKTHEFVYVDGLFECDPPEGVEAFFPGPYLCYYNIPTLKLVSEAYDFIRETIEEEGPFDGVIGFSQGAALAASMMLQHAKENPYGENLFKLAVFAGASLPYNLEDNTRLSKHETEISETPQRPQAISVHGTPDLEPRAFPAAPESTNEPFLGRYHPESETDKSRIETPTLHLIGSLDQFAPQSELLARLCSGNPTIVRHDAGHEVPNERLFVQKAIAAMDALICEVTFQI